MDTHLKPKVITLSVAAFLLLLMFSFNITTDSTQEHAIEPVPTAKADGPEGWVVCNNTDPDGDGSVLSCGDCSLTSGVEIGPAGMCNTCDADPVVAP